MELLRIPAYADNRESKCATWSYYVFQLTLTVRESKCAAWSYYVFQLTLTVRESKCATWSFYVFQLTLIVSVSVQHMKVLRIPAYADSGRE